jgi:hypothetical protein
MLKGIKDYLLGYKHGKKQQQAIGRTVGYDKGYVAGMKASKRTDLEKAELAAKVCLTLTVISFILGIATVVLTIIGG